MWDGWLVSWVGNGWLVGRSWEGGEGTDLELVFLFLNFLSKDLSHFTLEDEVNENKKRQSLRGKCGEKSFRLTSILASLASCKALSSACFSAGLVAKKKGNPIISSQTSSCRPPKSKEYEKNSLDLLEQLIILNQTQTQKFTSPILFIQSSSSLSQILHTRMNQHLFELDEVTVGFIVDLDGPPWVGTSSDLSTVGEGDEAVGSDDGEGDFALLKIVWLGEYAVSVFG